MMMLWADQLLLRATAAMGRKAADRSDWSWCRRHVETNL